MLRPPNCASCGSTTKAKTATERRAAIDKLRRELTVLKDDLAKYREEVDFEERRVPDLGRSRRGLQEVPASGLRN